MTDTLKEAQALVEQHRHKGIHCPCCGQMARNYKRHLNAPMARALIWLVRRALSKPTPWVDLRVEAPKFVHASRELAKLKHWKLIAQKEAESKRGARTCGIWRPTERGVQFAQGKIVLPSYVILYDNHIIAVSNVPISIRDSLKKRFKFEDLWRGL